MAHFQHRPLLCGAVGFALGIGLWASGLHSVAGALVLVLLGLGFLFTARPALVLAGLLLAGMGLGAVRLALFQTRSAADVSRWADGPAPVLVTGLVDSDPERHSGHVSFTLNAERIDMGRQTVKAAGQCIVTVPDTPSTPDYGDRVTLDGLLETPPRATNPGAFSWRDQLARRGIYASLLVLRPQSVHSLGPAKSNPILQFAWRVRHRVLDGIDQSLPSTQAAVLSGILIGQRADLPPELMDNFVRTGTVHILASAGLHVGILALCLFTLVRLLTLPRKWGALLLMLTLALYAIVCGGRPSVTRAVIVAVIYLGALLCERDPDGPTAIAAAALLILALQPTALLETGFQLSFLTVLTLALLMPAWNALWMLRLQRVLPRGLGRTAAVWGMELCGLAVIAQMGALPLVARDYNQISLLSVPANLLVVPMLFLVLPLGFAGAWVWPLWHSAGAALFWLCHFGLTWVVCVVQACAAPGWASVAVPSPTPGLIIGYYLALIGTGIALRRRAHSPAMPALAAAPAFAP